MDVARISTLLEPFGGDKEFPSLLLDQIRVYLDLLLRWNARVNLTAVRDAEQIVTRHFGESLFAARLLLGCDSTPLLSAADVGSGAGFPGIPLKLFAPALRITLIEAQHKKAVFLREAIRELKLEDVEVFCGRAEDWGKQADIVMLRAVERFDRVLPTAAQLLSPAGRLCLLIGSNQLEAARQFVALRWSAPVVIPQSDNRIVAIGQNT